jgi:hypothetical protein
MLLWSSAQTINQLGGCREETPSQKENSCHQVGCQGSFQTMPPQCINGGANLHSTSPPLPGSDDAQALFWRCTLPLGMGRNFRISLRFNKCNLVPLTLFATAAQAHVPPKEVLSDNVPFGIGQDLIINIPVNARGIVDMYINDFIRLTLDLEDSDNATRLEWAPLLGLTTVLPKVSPFEPLPLNDMDA